MSRFNILLIFILFLSFCIYIPNANAARPAPPDNTVVSGPNLTTELWQGKVLTATFKAGMCYDRKGRAHGVLLLRHKNGQQDVYHLNGTIRNNEFNLTHSSGHFFSGHFMGPDDMEGKARLKNGIKLNMKGKRIKNARLVADECAPLP